MTAGLLLGLFLGLDCSFPPPEVPSVRVDLIDGSRIVGQPEVHTVIGRTRYGAMEIPLRRLSRMRRLDGGELEVHFTNGDVLTLTPEFDSVNCATLFGDVTLKMEHVRAILVQSTMLRRLPARENLVLCYGFDHRDDGTIRNLVTDALHAKNAGAVWVPGGVHGGALKFDGSGRVLVQNDKRLCPPMFTLAAWVCPTTESASYEMLIGKTGPSSWSGGYGLCRVSGDSENITFFINGYTTTFQRTPLPVGKWTHLTCISHGEGIQLYVNGRPVSSEADARPPKTPLAARVQHTSTPLTLGADLSGYGWKGLMDEVVLYNRALSGAEVRQLYQAVREGSN